MAYVYLVLSARVKARSTIVGNPAPAVDAHKVFKDTFKSLIKGDLSIDIGKYQGVLEHALSKVDFSIGVGIYMLPSNLNLAIGRKEGYNKILVSNTDMKIGPNWDINNKKLPVAKPVARHDQLEVTRPHNLRMLTYRHNDQKLAIILATVGVWGGAGGGLIAYLLV